jgi:hypothetical protein
MESRINIGYLTLDKSGKIIIKDLLVEQKDNFSIAIPLLEITFSPLKLLNKNIDEITIIQPSIFLNLTERKKTTEERKTKMPFSLRKALIQDAQITLQLEENTSLHFDSLNLSFEQEIDSEKAKLRGKATIADFKTFITAEAVIDLDNLILEYGHLEIPDLDLMSASASNRLRILKDNQVTGLLTIKLNATKTGDIAEKNMVWQTDIFLKDFSISTKKLAVNLKDDPLTLNINGIYETKKDTITIEGSKILLSKLEAITFKGILEDISSGNPETNLELQSTHVPFSSIQKIISGPAVSRIQDIDIQANADAQFSLTGPLKNPRVHGDLSMSGEHIKSKNFIIESFNLKIPVSIKDNEFGSQGVSIKAQRGNAFSFRGKEPLDFSLDNIYLFTSPLHYKNGLLRPVFFEFSADEAAVSSKKQKKIFINSVSLKGSLESIPEKNIFKLNNLTLDSDFIEGLNGNIALITGKPLKIHAEILCENIHLEKISSKPLFDFLKEPGLSITGVVSLDTQLTATVSQEKSPYIAGNASLKIRDAGFSSSDGSYIGEGIALEASSTFVSSSTQKNTAFTINAEATGFELLMGKFYGDFKNRTINLSSAGQYEHSNDLLTLSHSAIGLSDMGNIIISGTVSNITKSPSFETELKVKNLSNKNFYNLFIRETYQEQIPLLSSLEINGITDINLSVKGTKDRFTAHGHIDIDSMDVSGEDGLSAHDITVSLPFDISYPEAISSTRKLQVGSLKIRDISWKALNLKNLEVFPTLWQNNLTFQKDITLPIFGGTIRFDNISYSNILNSDRNLRLSVAIDNLDLSEISSAMDLPQFTGSLRGTIPKVNFTGNRLLTDGEVTLHLFNGKMIIRDLLINNAFSAISSLKSSIIFEEIDLGKLTKTFDFGHISGTLEGELNDLIIVKGQPEHFKTSVATVKKRGKPQKISVEALKKISILGTGSSTSILDRGIYQFFKEYRYEKIGFKAFLKNDTLQLRGIEKRGNVGYLVKGGILPPKVDVINYTQSISFKEMLNRLKRIKTLSKQSTSTVQ